MIPNGQNKARLSMGMAQYQCRMGKQECWASRAGRWWMLRQKCCSGSSAENDQFRGRWEGSRREGYRRRRRSYRAHLSARWVQ